MAQIPFAGYFVRKKGDPDPRSTFYPGSINEQLLPSTVYERRAAGPLEEFSTLAGTNLQTMTATVSPNPPAAGQPFTVVFSTVPDSTPGLTGTGLTRSGTAPASGDVVINATKAGYNPINLTAATQPAVAPAATGGALTLFQGSVFLEIPNITAGYPEPEMELTALTRNGTNILSELVGTDEIPDAVKSTSSTYSATWTITNGVGAGVTITRTLAVAAASITATVAPVSARLYAGQTPAAIPNIATFLNNTNYSTGTAQLQVNAENATTATVLNAGDVVSVLVTGSGVSRRWGLSNVEYAVKFVSKGAGGWAVDINNLIPGTTPVTLGWDGETTTTTRDAIILGPVAHVEPTIIQDGETFTIDNPGPWINEYGAGAIGFVYRWKRNGVLITGATLKTYTRVAADAGTTLTGQVTAHNANNDGVTRVDTANSIANPAAQTFEAFTALPGNYRHTTLATSSNTVTFADLDIGAAHAQRDILVFAAQAGANGLTITGATVDAGGQTIPMTLVRGQAGASGTPAAYVAAFHAKVPLGTTASVTLTTNQSTAGGVRFLDYRRGVGNTISAQNGAGTTGATNTASAALSGATVGHKVVAFSTRSSGADLTWTGATELYDLDPTGGTTRYISAADGVIPEGGALTVTAATAGGAQSAMIAIAAGA